VLPDLILLDNKMPGPTGYLVCQKLRSMYPHSELAIIIVSVRVDEGDAVQVGTLRSEAAPPGPLSSATLCCKGFSSMAMLAGGLPELQAARGVLETHTLPDLLNHTVESAFRKGCAGDAHFA